MIRSRSVTGYERYLLEKGTIITPTEKAFLNESILRRRRINKRRKNNTKIIYNAPPKK